MPGIRLSSLAVLIATSLPAQADRFELGLRLRQFERHLAATSDVARRDAAFAELDRAVQAFFRLDTAAVAAAIANADAALAGAAPTHHQRFAASLQLTLPQRLLPVDGDAPFELRACWRSDVELPAELTLRIEVSGGSAAIELPVPALPLTGVLPLAGVAAGDHELRWSLRAGGTDLGTRSTHVSVVPDRDRRLDALTAAADQAGGDLDGRTLAAHARTLRAMTKRRGEETVLPGARLLAEAEALARAVADGQPFHGPARPGQFRLRVPTATTTFAVRLLVPAAAADPAPPLVLALHGAGGSENLFFDGYGDGEIVRQCARRGFYLCAPRAGLGTPDLPALLDALAARYPFDRARVLLVGHSMGAAMAVACAGRAPARYAAVAALGGGGEVGDADGLQRLPFFVGTGSRDFLRRGAEQLRVRLEQLQAPVEWRLYQGVEHLAIVQIALPDVFTWFDRVLRP
jgi:predicted esterase